MIRDVLGQSHVTLEPDQDREVVSLNYSINDHQYELRSFYFAQLLKGNPRAIQQFDHLMELFRVPLQKKHLIMMVIRFDDFHQALLKAKIQSRELLDLAMMNIMDETLRMEANNGCSFQYKDDTYVVLFNRMHTSTRSIRESLVHCASRITSHLLQYLNISVSIDIGLPHSDLYTLGQQYEQGVEAISAKQFYGRRTVSWSQDSRIAKQENEYQSALTLISHVSKRLEMGEYGSIQHEISQFLDQIEVDQRLAEKQVKAFCLDIVYLLLQHKRQQPLPGEVLEHRDGTALHEAILQLSSFQKVKWWMRSWLEQWLEAVSSPRQPYTEPIQKAHDYIASHFEEEMSLQKIAHMVHLNKTYLCEQFKKETGISFTDYLTRLRISRAKELILLGDYKISDLAERVGYPNSSYFTRVFKKIMGMTPLDFKQSAKHQKHLHSPAVSRSSL
ncbi:AraC family transcriptional regulator [Paenibacillus radicis (ex Xue et al. 2023)]|uniref:AraC family transcriptional regulator n=1 Tax=Paenibacillus radicis (ex Xue et al. 2023) TaxID=2972489 RepID=A0ABT1YL34_9BACL|nr:AraC family transcriptional regulator [Paenibacillus radicis (ex Xue et al. 2023)]MCR8632670.1 AraC family transcriptional regulator [Paenibacillus radicis (ex Xue et al. 2023)]